MYVLYASTLRLGCPLLVYQLKGLQKEPQPQDMIYIPSQKATARINSSNSSSPTAQRKKHTILVLQAAACSLPRGPGPTYPSHPTRTRLLEGVAEGGSKGAKTMTYIKRRLYISNKNNHSINLIIIRTLTCKKQKNGKTQEKQSKPVSL